MGRVLVFTDRAPEDGSWKGALIWQIILSLAESQHEVLVASPLEGLTLTHPRLTLTRPVNSWRADQILPLSRLLLSWQPQVIQTFALAPSRLWPSLTVWPYLMGMLKALPHIQRVSTLFDEDDIEAGSASFLWHRSAQAVTVFSERQRTRAEVRLGRKVSLVPLETPPVAAAHLNSGVVVPAPVSEWANPDLGLQRLARFCAEDLSRQVHVLGGWGDWTAARRKRGWITIQEAAERIHFHPNFDYHSFSGCIRSSEALWLEPLRPDSWRFLLATHLGAEHGRKMILPGVWAPTVTPGSTANSLSRIYVGMGSQNTSIS